jgi:hypothetical protein
MFSARLVRASSRNCLQAGHSVTVRLLTAYSRPFHAAHSTRYRGATGGPDHSFVRFKRLCWCSRLLMCGGGGWGVRPACQNIAAADFHIQTFWKSTQICSFTAQMEGKFILQRSWHEEGGWEDRKYCCNKINGVENWDPDGVHYHVIMYVWCDAMQCGINLRTFRRKVPPPSSRWQSPFP